MGPLLGPVLGVCWVCFGSVLGLVSALFPASKPHTLSVGFPFGVGLILFWLSVWDLLFASPDPSLRAVVTCRQGRGALRKRTGPRIPLPSLLIRSAAALDQRSSPSDRSWLAPLQHGCHQKRDID